MSLTASYRIYTAERQAVVAEKGRSIKENTMVEITRPGTDTKTSWNGDGPRKPLSAMRKHGFPVPASLHIGGLMWQDAEMTRKAGDWILSCLKSPRKDTTSMYWGVVVATIVLTIVFVLMVSTLKAEAQSTGFVTECSYYTYSSCLREGTSGICANGEKLNDEAFTGASWDYKFGQLLKVRNLRNNREIVLRINDRGPNKRLYKSGRRLDVSLASAKALGFVNQGITKVEVTVI